MKREGVDFPPGVPWADDAQGVLTTSRETIQGMVSGTNPLAGFILLVMADLCARTLGTTPDNTPWASLVLIAATVLGERRFSVKLCCFLVIQLFIMKLLDYQALASSPGQQTPGFIPKMGFGDAVTIWLFTFSGPIIFLWADFVHGSWTPLIAIFVNLQHSPLWLETVEHFLNDPTKENMMAALFQSWAMTIPILASMVALLPWASIRNAISKVARVSRKGLRLVRSNWVLAGPVLVAAKQFGSESYAPPDSYTREWLQASIYLFLYFFASEAWGSGVVFVVLSSAFRAMAHLMDFLIEPSSLGNLALFCAMLLPLALYLDAKAKLAAVVGWVLHSLSSAYQKTCAMSKGLLKEDTRGISQGPSKLRKKAKATH